MERSAGIAFKPEYLGFAAVLATLPIYEPALHSFHTIAPDSFGAGVAPYSWAALATALACSALIGIDSRRARGLQEFWSTSAPYKAAMAVCGIAGAAGPCLLAGPGLPPALAVLLGAAGGAGSALLLAAWGRLFCSSGYRTVLAHLAIAGILGAFLMNAVGTLPYPLACALFGIFELVALGVPLALGKPGTPAAPSRGNADSTGIALGGIALFGLAFTLLGSHTVPYFYLSFLVGTIVAGIAVLPVLLWHGERSLAPLFCNAVLPLVGFAAVAVAVVAPCSTASRAAFMVFCSFAIPLLLASIASKGSPGASGAPGVLWAAVGAYSGASLAGMGLSAAVPLATASTVFTVAAIVYLAAAAVQPTFAAWRTRTPDHDATPEARIAVPPAAAEAVADRYRLTEREAQILSMLAAGATSGEIAEALVISNSTARGHAHKIYQKLGVSTRDELLGFLARESEEVQAPR